jgi:hypothetical protein
LQGKWKSVSGGQVEDQHLGIVPGAQAHGGFVGQQRGVAGARRAWPLTSSAPRATNT